MQLNKSSINWFFFTVWRQQVVSSKYNIEILLIYDVIMMKVLAKSCLFTHSANMESNINILALFALRKVLWANFASLL